MTIKEEFEKALYEEFKDRSNVLVSVEIIALWAAKWMAERCAKEIEYWEGDKAMHRRSKMIIKRAAQIRELAKYLEA